MRLPELEESALSEAQREVLQAIRSGPRASQHGAIGLVGPFGVWVRAPQIGNAIQALGAAARYQTELDEAVKEVAICTVGAFYQAKFEFAAHGALARAAGVSEQAVEQLRVGQTPDLPGPQALANRVARSLLEQHRIDVATYGEALAEFGEQGLIELVSVIGYYCLVSLTLNAFEVPVREGMADPFP